MYLIAGLGNPERKYHGNRHNVGFMFADYLARLLSPAGETAELFTRHDKFQSLIHDGSHGRPSVFIIKPQTFMNRSGAAIRKTRDFYKIPTEQIYIAHDDLDIPLGMFKIQQGTGPKVHNGLTSTEQQLGSKQFWRVRIGIESRTKENRLPGEAFVLQDFTPQEVTTVTETFAVIADRLRTQYLR